MARRRRPRFLFSLCSPCAPAMPGMTNAKSTANAAIYYQPRDLTPVDGLRPACRRRRLFRGFVAEHAGCRDLLPKHTRSSETFQHFSESRFCPNRTGADQMGSMRMRLAELAEAGRCIFQTPVFHRSAPVRRQSARLFPLPGVTIPPPRPAGWIDWWFAERPGAGLDALICTVGGQGYRHLLSPTLRANISPSGPGADAIPRPQLPVILCVDVGANAGAGGLQKGLSGENSASPRTRSRSVRRAPQPLRLRRIPADVFGSEQAAGRQRQEDPPDPIRLVRERDRTRSQDRRLVLCPSGQLHLLDGRQKQVRSGVWQAADIFTRSDNIQETLRPDANRGDGGHFAVGRYRLERAKDTIRDGIDGIRVPTLMPCWLVTIRRTGMRRALDTYDLYCGYTSQFVAVEPAACAKAHLSLIEQPELRAVSSWRQARHRGVSTGAWSMAAPGVWAELAERRKSAIESVERRGDRPSHLGSRRPIPRLLPSSHRDPVGQSHSRNHAGCDTLVASDISKGRRCSVSSGPGGSRPTTATAC